MAVNSSRSMNSELREGATDGALKKTRPNLSGITRDVSNPARELLRGRVNSFNIEAGEDHEGVINTGVVGPDLH